jgi:hypothetical protein
MSPPERPFLSADEIDALMRAPVKPRPSVIVVGDDDVVGFTPAPAPVEAEPASFNPPPAVKPRLFGKLWPFVR